MLLRRVIEHVKAQNWTAVALDFVIVVVGVFIGIQVSNWNADHDEKEREAVMLTQIRTSIKADLSALNTHLDRFHRAEAALNGLLKHIENKEPYDQSLDQAFGLMYGYGYLNLDRAAYESVKSEGVNLISNAQLRAEIAGLYEKTYHLLEKSMEDEANVVLFMRPYFINNFRNLRFTISATPMDYDSLIEDIQLRNLTDYRLQVIRENHLVHLTAGAKEMERLIKVIDLELEKR